MISRRKARETALKILYNMEMSDGGHEGIMEAQLDLLMSGSRRQAMPNSSSKALSRTGAQLTA